MGICKKNVIWLKMITNKKDFREYIEADKKALNVTGNHLINVFTNPCYKYQRSLRLHEYCHNCLKKWWQCSDITKL